MSTSCVSGISAFHFRTYWSLDELWIFQVGPATYKYGRAERSDTTKTSSTLQACSFFRILSRNSASQPPHFLPSSCSTCLSKHLTHWKFQSIALDSEKGELSEHFSSALVMPFSHESEHTKLMILLIINLPLAVSYLQPLSCVVIDKSQCDLNSSNSDCRCALPCAVPARPIWPSAAKPPAPRPTSDRPVRPAPPPHPAPPRPAAAVPPHHVLPAPCTQPHIAQSVLRRPSPAA